MALAKSIYAVPTWTRTVALVNEHHALRAAIAVSTPVPSVYACYRFTAKLRAYGDMLDRCIDGVTARLSAELPAARHPRRQAWLPQAPGLRARRLAVRGSRLRPQGNQVALPDRRVQARLNVGKANRLHPLIPRETPRFTALYRRRAAVEREFGRLKNEWALSPLRVRGLDRVRLHADLTILATLACALARARAVPLAA
jgi:hypothetical protein